MLAGTMVIIILISGIVGYIWGASRHTPPPETTTFYATIEEMDGNRLLVEGLSVNDINFRGEFDFSISDATILEWRYTALRMDELNVGDTLSITFAGPIQESYPAKISHVVKIQLLDDEK